jgi:uncharacterized repeat protein (TIGR01451 family)
VVSFILLSAFCLISARHATAAIINQPMTGSSAPGWVFGGTPTSALLTGTGAPDPVGDGWLRLTNNNTNQAGYAFYDTPFDVSNGVVIQFDYVTYGGTGADGYTVFLFDGGVTPATFQIGASGGSLGYAPKTAAPVSPGLSSGYIGVGIDEFGNFSNPTEGRTGGPGQRAQSVAVRGPASSNYAYIGGTAANIGTLWFAGTRPVQTGPNYRKVIIQLTPVAAPNYLRADVYIQFGAGQSYTQVLSGLNVGLQPPATVKIGFAASTGGSTNYHEIRNLVIDPLSTAINLGMTKTASLASIALNSALTYTVTARNYGPSNVTASNVPISDNVPPQLTGVTWNCAGSSGGATCGAASGVGNAISTTATLPFNGTVTYTISGTLTATPPGSVLTNSASLTVPGGVTDYNPADNSASVSVNVVGAGAGVTVSGTVYNDVNLNGVLDGGETSSNINNIFAKLFKPDGTWLQTVAVNQASGAYSFNAVPAFGTYTVILSNNNAATFTPAFPDIQWVFTQPLNYTLTNVSVGNANVTGQNFGVFRGTRLAGRVFVDNGIGGGIANDGLQNGSEAGLYGVAVGVCNNTANCTGSTNTIATTTTDSNGDYVLFIPWASGFNAGTARVAHNLLTNYQMVNYNAGTTPGSAVSTAGAYMTFTFARGTGHSGILLGDVLDNTFVVTPQAQTSPAGTTVYYPHTFTPGSGGSLAISVNSRTQAAWPAVVPYRDTACDGIYSSASDPVLTNPIVVTFGSPVCILAAVSIPVGAATGTVDTLTVRSTFTFTGSARPAASTYDVVDTTTVGPSSSLTVNKLANPTPKVTSGVDITYTMTVTNIGGGTALNVLVVDDFSPYTQWNLNSFGAGVPFQFTDGSPVSGLTMGTPLYSNDRGATWLYTPTSGGGGAPAGYDGNVTSFRLPMTGTMNANNANFTVKYVVKVK